MRNAQSLRLSIEKYPSVLFSNQWYDGDPRLATSNPITNEFRPKWMQTARLSSCLESLVSKKK